MVHGQNISVMYHKPSKPHRFYPFPAWSACLFSSLCCHVLVRINECLSSTSQDPQISRLDQSLDFVVETSSYTLKTLGTFWNFGSQNWLGGFFWNHTDRPRSGPHIMSKRKKCLEGPNSIYMLHASQLKVFLDWDLIHCSQTWHWYNSLDPLE